MICGCVEKTPAPDTDSIPSVNEVSIAYLKTLYKGRPVNISQEVDISGVVTADDCYGAFTKSLMIEDETGGIEIKLNSPQLFPDYPIGRHLRVRCYGLTLGGYGGEVSLGVASDDERYENSAIPSSDIALYIHKKENVEKPKPRKVNIGTITKSDISRFVCLDNVQFIGEEVGLTWCDMDQNTNRHLIDKYGDTLTVRTDRTAQFAYEILPSGSGYIEGILGYFGGKYQLRLVYGKFAVMGNPRF